MLPVFYSGLLPTDISQLKGKVTTPSPQLPAEIVATPSPLSADLILERLSYSHIELLLEMDDPFKRAFYEVECLKGGWSVRELKRQIGSLYFERSGLSRDKEALSRLANADAEARTPALTIRDPYVFEILGLHPQEVLPESALEAALLAKLEAFLLELGHGFCFEARQKRLLIGEESLPKSRSLSCRRVFHGSLHTLVRMPWEPSLRPSSQREREIVPSPAAAGEG